MSDPNIPDPSSDWRDQRRADRAQRHGMRRMGGGAPIAGLVILVIGAALLADNMGYHLPEHWWAALLLIPAGGSLVSAARFWRVDNRLSSRVIASLAGGVAFLLVACSIFFGMNWSFLWPALLIMVGAGLMARSYWPRG